MRRLPKYVHGFVDRQGRPRHYLRLPGVPKVALPGLPWSEPFMAAYHAALTPPTPATIVASAGADRIVPRSLRALAVQYFASAAFSQLKPISQGRYRSQIEAFCQTLDRDGRPYGDKPAGGLQRKHVEELMARRADQPDAANMLRRMLRELFKVAILQDWRQDDPTIGTAKFKRKNLKGYHRWTDAEITAFEGRHPVGSMARLAMSLGLFTGQARQDVIAMGAQHITREYDAENDCDFEILNWTRIKTENSTGLGLSIPLHPVLRAVIDATPSDHMLFLVDGAGRPFDRDSFSTWFRTRCDEAGLPGCTFHGLRKASLTRLIDAGCDAIEAASISGHASLKELQRYIEERDRKQAARRAMGKLVASKTRTKLANAKPRLATASEKA